MSKKTTLGEHKINISNLNLLFNLIDKNKPELVINCCAATDVDLIQSNPNLGIKSNVLGVLNLNQICSEKKIKQIYFSTEAAYDGKKTSPYFEFDEENPQSYYALTKVIADRIVLNSSSQSWIFRTSWLYSLNSKSTFVTRILEKSKSSSDKIGVTSDIVGNPTPAWWLAKTVLDLIPNLDILPPDLYHLCSTQPVSKYDWAKRIVSDLNPEKNSLIIPTKRLDYPNANLRSPYVDLSTSKIQKALNLSTFPNWEELWLKTIN